MSGNTQSAATFDRIPPQNMDAERSVLGAMLLNPDSIEPTMRVIENESAFYAPAHQYLYAAMLVLREGGKAVDAVTLTNQLNVMDKLQGAGGMAYISEITGSVPTSANIEQYAKIVRDQHKLREVIVQASQITGLAYDSPGDVVALIDDAHERFGGLVMLPDDRIQHVSKNMKDFMDNQRDRAAGLIEPGLRTDIERFDELTDGLEPGDNIVVAARPSVGKTAFGLNVCTNIMKRNYQSKIIFISKEMGYDQLMKRMCSSINNVNFRRINHQNEADVELKRLEVALNIIKRTQLFIDDTSNCDIDYVMKRLRGFHAQHGSPDIIVLDYMQMMHANSKKFSSGEQEIGYISRSIKEIARELGCPILNLCQINRAGLEGIRPTIHHLRGSGAIEQDADDVLILNPDKEVKTVLWGYLDKQRNGPTGYFAMRFVKHTQNIHSISNEDALAKEDATYTNPIYEGDAYEIPEQEEIPF